MIGLLFMTAIALWVTLRVSAGLVPHARRIFHRGMATLAIAGLLLSLAYTAEAEWLFNEPDLPGDATSYINGAESLMAGMGTASFYPLYEGFLAAHLWMGHPVCARLGQLLLVIVCYQCGFLGLCLLGSNCGTLTWYSGIFSLNGIYYGLATQLVRDSLLLFGFSLLFLAVAYGFAARARLWRATVLAAIAAGVIAQLSNWVLYTCAAGVFAEILAGMWTGRRSLRARLTMAACLCCTAAFFLGSRDVLSQLYKINVEDEIGRKEADARHGIRPVDTSFAPARLLLGPGVLRPLMWKKYFWYSTWCHSLMFVWGMVLWYVLLILSVPVLLFRLPDLVRHAGARYAATCFLVLFTVYAVAYGSGLGMRKRALLQFLFLLAVAAAGVFEERGFGLRSILLRGRTAAAAAALFGAILLANYWSL